MSIKHPKCHRHQCLSNRIKHPKCHRHQCLSNRIHHLNVTDINVYLTESNILNVTDINVYLTESIILNVTDISVYLTESNILNVTDIQGLTPGEVQDSKICDTLGCHRFYYLAPFTVFDSFSHPFYCVIVCLLFVQLGTLICKPHHRTKMSRNKIKQDFNFTTLNVSK